LHNTVLSAQNFIQDNCKIFTFSCSNWQPCAVNHLWWKDQFSTCQWLSQILLCQFGDIT